DRGRGGKICLIASGAYKSARRRAAHYCASKAGLVLLARTLALELAEHHINVNVVSPGLIEVALRRGVSIPYREKIKHDIPWGRFGTPDEIAAAVAEFITGTVRSWMWTVVRAPAVFNCPSVGLTIRTSSLLKKGSFEAILR
ncbi:MAG: SDR family oxidoreductase, partial [Actinomycetota bacterium]|nr:SDR family oxidoreductase [Actinomycetota bacterium]